MTFDVRVDGKERADLIHVGRLGVSPKGLPFSVHHSFPNHLDGLIRTQCKPGHPGLWIWYDRGWHLRVTTDREHRFAGLIRTEDAAFEDVHPVSDRWNGEVHHDVPGELRFDKSVTGDADDACDAEGFDWDSSRGCVRFDMTIDGAPATNRLAFGYGAPGEKAPLTEFCVPRAAR